MFQRAGTNTTRPGYQPGTGSGPLRAPPEPGSCRPDCDTPAPEVLNALGGVAPAQQQEVASVLDKLTQDADMLAAMTQTMNSGQVLGLPGDMYYANMQACPGELDMVGYDEYGPTCAQDFGNMCPLNRDGTPNPLGGCYVAAMCKVSCGVTKPASEAVVEAIFWGGYHSTNDYCTGKFGPRIQASCDQIAEWDAKIAAGENPVLRNLGFTLLELITLIAILAAMKVIKEKLSD